VAERRLRQGNEIRVVIADDHAVVREGLVTILQKLTPKLTVVGEARNWTEAIAAVDEHKPDLALLDVRMPGMIAAEGVAALRSKHPELRIVLISAFDCDEDIYGVIRVGADGFMTKSSPPYEISACIQTVLEGKRWLSAGPAEKLLHRMQAPDLSPRQKEILEKLADGKTNKEIGALLGITEGTVKVQLNHIFQKLGTSNRTEAITKGLQRGLVRLKRQA
jgi:two-component system NarL family response regulator